MSSERRVFDYPWSNTERKCSDMDDFAIWNEHIFDTLIDEPFCDEGQWKCKEWQNIDMRIKAEIYQRVVWDIEEDRENQKEASEE